MSYVGYLILAIGRLWLILLLSCIKYLRLSHVGSDVGQMEFIIGVQLRQKNPNQRVHRSSGKRRLPR